MFTKADKFGDLIKCRGLVKFGADCDKCGTKHVIISEPPPSPSFGTCSGALDERDKTVGALREQEHLIRECEMEIGSRGWKSLVFGTDCFVGSLTCGRCPADMGWPKDF